MRGLMYFTIGFGTVTGACVYADGKPLRYLAAVMLVILLCRIEKNVPFKKKGFLALMGGIVGLCLFSRFQSRYLSPILPLDGQTVLLTIRASDYEESRDYGVFFAGTVELEGHTYQIQTRLKEAQNIQPGMTVTGDFSLQSAGFLIENGVKTTPVKGFTVAGNFYELLKNITALADDTKLHNAFGKTAFGAPSTLVHGLSIAGK